MPLHYNAFISYKHAPADIAVAKDIQHRLEHFRVPKPIREKTGKQKIERIFRDQEELPITSDLNRDIAYALEDAEYLIVICSSSTKLSTWVPREIAKFLETHERSRVLTVLVDGEPNDVIPQILREEVVTETDEDGVSHEVTRVFEPLSCDYRDLKTAHKTEIPRLAAALLGCSYDELVMRARQYKRRRITALASVIGALAAIAIGYLIWSNAQIRTQYERAEANYQLAQQNYALSEQNRLQAEANWQQAEENLSQARRNQSVYLANEAIKALGSEDRVLAVELAMEALPGSSRPDWPYVPLAEYALSRAVNAYVVPTSADTDREAAVWDVTMNGYIGNFAVDQTERILCAYDSTGHAAGWDLLEHRERFTLETGHKLTGIRFFRDGDTLLVLLSGETELIAADAKTGEIVWRFDGGADERIGGLRSTFRWYLSNTGLYVCVKTYSAEGGNLWIDRLDPANGSVAWQSEVLPYEGLALDAFALTKDQDALFFQTDWSEAGVDHPVMRRLDLESGIFSEIPLPVELAQIGGMKALDGHRMVIFGAQAGNGGSYVMLDYLTVTKEMKGEVLCVDDRTGDLLWHSTMSSSGLNYRNAENSLGVTHYTDTAGTERELLWCLYADEVYSFDTADGVLFEHDRLTAPLVGAGSYASGDGFLAMLADGTICGFRMEQEELYSQPCFDKEILKASFFYNAADQAGFVAMTEDKLQVFEVLVDEEGEAFADGLPYDYMKPENTAVSGDTLVVARADRAADTVMLDLYSLTERRCEQTVTVEGISRYRYAFEGILGGQAVVSSAWSGENGLVTVNAETGECSEPYRLKEELGVTSVGAYVCRGQEIWALTTDYGKPWALIPLTVGTDGNITAGEAVEVPTALVPAASWDVVECRASEDGSILSLIVRDSSYEETERRAGWYRFDVGEWVIPEEFPAQAVTADALAEADTVVLGSQTDVFAYAMDGTPRYMHTEPDATIIALKLASAAQTGEKEPLLLLALTSFRLDRREAVTGVFAGGQEIDYYDVSYADCVRWTFADGELILQLDDALNIIDLSEWTGITSTQGVLAYSPDSRLLISQARVPDESGTTVSRLWCFPRYTVDDLRRKGEAFLHGAELSDTEKDIYGIER